MKYFNSSQQNIWSCISKYNV